MQTIIYPLTVKNVEIVVSESATHDFKGGSHEKNTDIV